MFLIVLMYFNIFTFSINAGWFICSADPEPQLVGEQLKDKPNVIQLAYILNIS